MPVNVKLLKKVRKLIAEEPRRLRMGTWGFRYKGFDLANYEGAPLPPCGTVACLAGHIILATKPRRDWRKLFTSGGCLRESTKFNQAEGVNGAAEKAAKLIGLKVNDCPFGQTGWGKREVLAWIDRQIDAASK